MGIPSITVSGLGDRSLQDKRKIITSEYSRLKIPYGFNSRDMRILDQLQGITVFQIEPEVYYIKIGAVIGVINLSNVQIRVKSKIKEIQTRFFEYLQISGYLPKTINSDVKANFSDRANSEVDIIAAVFLSLWKGLKQRGIGKFYSSQTRRTRSVRGRINFSEQLKRNHSRRDVFHCTFNVLDTDRFENRVILYVASLLANLVNSSDIKHMLLSIISGLKSTCTVPKMDNRQIIHRLQSYRYDRKTVHYKAIHELSISILQGSTIGSFGSKIKSGMSFLIRTDKLFEKFVENILSKSLGNILKKQKSYPVFFIGGETRDVRPDIVIESQGSQIVIDCKYIDLDTQKINREILFQMFLYSQVFRNKAPAHCTLIYPSSLCKKREIVVKDTRGNSIGTITVIGLSIDIAIQKFNRKELRQFFQIVHNKLIYGTPCE